MAIETDAHVDARGNLVFSLAVVLRCHRKGLLLMDLIYVPLAVECWIFHFMHVSFIYIDVGELAGLSTSSGLAWTAVR